MLLRKEQGHELIAAEELKAGLVDCFGITWRWNQVGSKMKSYLRIVSEGHVQVGNACEEWG